MSIAPTTRANYLKACAYIAESERKRYMWHTRPMWVALGKKNRITATWYRGCVQPFHRWRAAIKSLGYRAVKVRVVFPW